jgi:hypothetical protein
MGGACSILRLFGERETDSSSEYSVTCAEAQPSYRDLLGVGSTPRL